MFAYKNVTKRNIKTLMLYCDSNSKFCLFFNDLSLNIPVFWQSDFLRFHFAKIYRFEEKSSEQAVFRYTRVGYIQTNLNMRKSFSHPGASNIFSNTLIRGRLREAEEAKGEGILKIN